jgi:uridine kinase
VDPHTPLTSFAALAEQIRAAPAKLGRTRLVAIDGPAGAGKTTFAARLACALGPAASVVHMDDLYDGWTLDGAAARLVSGVLLPLADDRAGAFHRYDWVAERFDQNPTPVPVPDVLVVEGCGSCPRDVDPWTTLRIWVEAPADLRLQRGLARDGAVLEPQWRTWQRTEAAEFTREDTRARADLRVDGAAAGLAGGFATLPR